jgi:transposase
MNRITFCAATVKRFEEELQKAYRLGDKRLIRRISVLLATNRQTDIAGVAATWGIARQTVYDWIAAFLEKSWDSLVYRVASGRPPRLTKAEKQELYEAVKAGPEACGFSSGCWTSVLIQEWIEKKFGVHYNRFYVNELLHSLNLSFQKARFVSDHLDEEARQNWMKEKWPEIMNRAKELGAPIFFGDEASFAQWGSLSYTWAPVGEQPQVKTTGIRKGYKVFGSIEFFSGQLIYQGLEERFNSDSYQVFLKYLLSHFTGPVILIQDGARYHTSKATREFISAHKDQLIVYQLPSYSPDYNPIEYLWKKVKTKATHNRYFEEFVKLVQSVEDALKVLATQADEISHLMGVYTKHLADPQVA